MEIIDSTETFYCVERTKILHQFRIKSIITFYSKKKEWKEKLRHISRHTNQECEKILFIIVVWRFFYSLRNSSGKTFYILFSSYSTKAWLNRKMRYISHQCKISDRCIIFSFQVLVLTKLEKLKSNFSHMTFIWQKMHSHMINLIRIYENSWWYWWYMLEYSLFL